MPNTLKSRTSLSTIWREVLLNAFILLLALTIPFCIVVAFYTELWPWLVPAAVCIVIFMAG